ncbi:MAG: hypothetical protein HZB76_05445 [Chlamydiae bacterium]|nr:hypothetical protein [Chlamydiota bacterium]
MTESSVALIIRSRHDPTHYFSSPHTNELIEKIQKTFENTKFYLISSKEDLSAILIKFQSRTIEILLLQGHGNPKIGGLRLPKDKFLCAEDITPLNFSNIEKVVLHSCGLAPTLGRALSKKTRQEVWASNDNIFQIRLLLSPLKHLKVFFSPSADLNENPYNLLAINNNTTCIEDNDMEKDYDLLINLALYALAQDKQITIVLKLLTDMQSIIRSQKWSQKLSDDEIKIELDVLHDNIYLPLYDRLKKKEDFATLRNLLYEQISLSGAFKDNRFRLAYLIKMQKQLLELAESLFHAQKMELIHNLFYEPFDRPPLVSNIKYMIDIIVGYISIHELEIGEKLTFEYITDDPFSKEILIKNIIKFYILYRNSDFDKVLKLIDHIGPSAQKEGFLQIIAKKFIDSKEYELALESVKKMEFPSNQKYFLALAICCLESEKFSEALQISNYLENSQLQYQIISDTILKLIETNHLSDGEDLMTLIPNDQFKDMLKESLCLAHLKKENFEKAKTLASQISNHQIKNEHCKNIDKAISERASLPSHPLKRSRK